MKNIKKALVFVVSILLILAFANFSFASSITAKNSTNSSENSATNNSTDNSISNNSTSNKIANNTSNTSNTSNISNSVNQTSNSSKTINTTNSSEDLPHTGIDKTYFNFAMILLLALVLSMFSLVQYHKISKKDE